MKTLIRLFQKTPSILNFMLLAVGMFTVSGIHAQEKQSITGTLLEQKTRQAIPFATVALIRISDSAMINGATSDDKGTFTISPVLAGNYRLRVSAIGYKTETISITAGSKGVTDAGTIYLEEATLLLKELEVVGDQVKAKSEGDRTSFFVTKKMLDVSSTGMDVLKFIPGVQVDLQQNISLEGSRNIQVFVDGKERDASFMGQLDPRKIEKVEIISRSSSDLDGSSTGAINIVLKKDRNPGIAGQICAEIPTTGSEIYAHPSFTLNIGLKKMNLYTSYNGDLTYLDLHESISRKSWNSSGTNEIISNQQVRQKNWSHRINLGLDYSFTSSDQVSFYGYYNPWSRELDGTADAQISGSVCNYWHARKEDSDRNTGIFSSVFYKHNFKKEGNMIRVEISEYNLDAKSSTDYIPEGNETTTAVQTNITAPKQNVTTVKMDFTTTLRNLNFGFGGKARFQDLQDGYLPGFYYTENIYAAYGTVAYKHKNYDLSLGVRAEQSVTMLKNTFSIPVLSFFPNAAFNYKITSRQNILLSGNRSIKRPSLYQLNPAVSIDDPYTVSAGNPYLKPELRTTVFLEYSIRFKSNYFASRLFYNSKTRVINDLTFINDTGAFETQPQNLGGIQQYGVQLSGTFKLGILTINPFLKIHDQSTAGNALAQQYYIGNSHKFGFEFDLSAILSFKHDFSLSMVFQYASPNYGIQGNSFSGALYFLSLEKTFLQKIKVGVVSALPFTKTFTYNGSEVDASNFTSHYEGNVNISNPFCWLKLSYSFSSGKRKAGIDHATEEMENLPKKGF
jgi:hypothetical protein